MICPKCKDTLEPITVSGVEVDRCHGCEGVWFDKHELRTLLEEDDRRTRSLQKGRDTERLDVLPGVCPRDAQPLRRTPGSFKTPVMIDYCPTCQGIWLDAGEFKKLNDANPDAPLSELIG